MERIRQIHFKIPNTHLVMHGSSSVPKNLIADINKYGGKIKETYGVHRLSEIKEGIKNGVRKINVDTDLRLSINCFNKEIFFENPSEFDPRKYLLLSKDAMKEVVKNKLEVFGAAGNASKIKPSTLSIMASRYQSGEFGSITN